MEPYESKWVDDTSRNFDIGKGPNLQPLSQANFDIEDKNDVRGWKVIGTDGGEIGEVDDLIVDPKKKEVRYLDVEAVDELGREGIPRHMLIPIGAARMDDMADKVLLKNISKEQLAKCPPFKGCPITRDFEYELHASIGNHLDPGTANPSPGTDYNEDNFYKHPIFDKASFYRTGSSKD